RFLVGARARARGRGAAEEIPEKISGVRRLDLKALERSPAAESRRAGSEARRRRIEAGGRPRVSEPVVGAPLFVLLEDVVGLLDLLKLFLPLFFAPIHVR